jgi:hypothetical protein
MRTTVRVDEALIWALKDFANRTGTPFKDVLDRALRAGIAELARKLRAKPHKARTESAQGRGAIGAGAGQPHWRRAS